MRKLTNSQKVMQLASQMGGKINSKTFFLSWQVKKYFEDKVMGLTKRYDRNAKVNVKINWTDEQESAYTDHRNIVVNANWNCYKGLNRPYKFLVMQGVVWHEAAHLLYTDKSYKMVCIKELKDHKALYPAPTVPNQRLNDLILEGKHPRAVLWIWNHIRNCLEDGYIEYRFLDEYSNPMFRDGLMAMRETFLKTFSSSVKELAAQEQQEGQQILFSILSILLEYAKFGVLPYKNRKEYADERIQAVVQCIPYIDVVNTNDDSPIHYEAINDVVSILGEYICDYLDTLPEEEPDNDPQELSQLLKQMAQQAGMNESDPGDPGDDGDGGDQPLATPRTGGTNGQKPTEEQAGKPTAFAEQEEPEVTEQSIAQTAATIQSLLNGIAEEKAQQQLEKEAQEALREENQTMQYNDIHAGVTCDIVRATKVSESTKQAYEQNVKSQIETLVRVTVKGLKQLLKDRRTGGTMRGLYFGKSISPVSYSRCDRKYFQNKKLPTDSPTLSIAVVLDESGSMGGRKLEAAKTMALVVYRFCEELGIRLMIIGHTASSGHVTLYNYCDFNGSYDSNDIYRIFEISSHSCNRDGYALQYATNRLKKESSDMKLCLVISDGAPNDDGYGGEIAYADLRKIVKDAKYAHIDTVVAAIDDDKEDIKKIYGEDSFLDITDLTKLPSIICGVIKKHLPRM